MADTIAAVFAHPDDEVLACGASLAKHVDYGDRVCTLIMATGLAARTAATDKELSMLRDQSRNAAKVLGAEPPVFWDFPDNRMDSVALLDVIKVVSDFFEDVQPSLIYTHHGGDLNVDHRIVHQAVVTEARPVPGTPPLEIRACEVNSSTEWAPPPLVPFEPNLFNPVAETIERKLEALACYESEIRHWPHPRSIEGVRALSRWRGSQCGYHDAEAFALIRKVCA